MKHFTRVLWLATLNIPLLVAAAELPSRRYQLALDPAAQSVQTPPLNAEKALAEDALADKVRRNQSSRLYAGSSLDAQPKCCKIGRAHV